METAKGSVFFLANAGFYAQYGGRSVLVDGLHQGKTRFSSMDDEQVDRVVRGVGRFRHIDCMLVTHAHADHYDRELTQAFLRNHPETSVVGPSDPMAGLPGPLKSPAGSVMMPGITIAFMRLRHEGEEYRNVKNYGYLVTFEGGYRFLTFGDAEVSADTTRLMSPGIPVDAAFVNFPFITLRAGRNALKKELDARRLYAIHLPFAEDDADNYRKSVLWSASKAKEIGLPPVTILGERNMVLPLK